MHQGVTVVLGGFSALEHLEEMAAVSGIGSLEPELMARGEVGWRANFGFAGAPRAAGGQGLVELSAAWSGRCSSERTRILKPARRLRALSSLPAASRNSSLLP